MTRIIAGTHRGRRLRTPSGAATRPTTDRVREATYGRIESRMELADARVLDLYAGSGALGFEAASRGAVDVLAIESNRAAADLIRRNADELGLARVVRVRAEDVPRVLSRPPVAPYDLVVADPPYATTPDAVDKDLADLGANGWLADGALVVLERDRRAAPPTWPAGFGDVDGRTYGDTTMYLARYSAPARDSAATAPVAGG